MELMFGTTPLNKPQKTSTSIAVIKKALKKPQGNVIIKKKKTT